MSNTEFHNFIGQRLGVGDVVGWGRRQGNQSAHQVGIVLELKDKGTTEAKCLWVSEGTRATYSSSTEASVLFVLDPKTLGQELYDKITQAAHGYAEEVARQEAARDKREA